MGPVRLSAPMIRTAKTVKEPMKARVSSVRTIELCTLYSDKKGNQLIKLDK